MSKEVVEVVIDEELSEGTQLSMLRVAVIVNGNEGAAVSCLRDASPQHISDKLNEYGCLIKYEDTSGLTEEDKKGVGDMLIEASYNVPGLAKHH